MPKTTVGGGVVVCQSVKTGRFVSVHTSKGLAKAHPKIVDLVKETSGKRRAALQLFGGLLGCAIR